MSRLTDTLALIRPSSRNRRKRRVTPLGPIEALEGRALMSVAGWVVPYVSTVGATTYSVALDGIGDVYTTGTFEGTTVDGLSSPSVVQVFVSKHDTNGNLLWSRQMGGSSRNTGMNVAADASGNVYVSGIYTGNATFGSTTLAGTADNNSVGFVTKLDPAGNFLWAQRIGTPPSSTHNGMTVTGSIAVDAGGNVFVSGQYGTDGLQTTTASIGSITLPATRAQRYVAKLDPSGNALWVTTTTGSYSGSIYDGALAIDGAGGVYITGQYLGTVNFGSTRLKSGANTGQVFVARLNTNGQFLWAATSGGNTAPSGSAITADAGNVYVGGVPEPGGILQFGTTSISTTTNEYGYVARLDPTTRAFTWAKELGGRVHSMAEDGLGHIVLGGDLGVVNVTGVFGPQTLTTAGGSDGWVSRLDASGNYLGTWQYGGTGRDTVLGVAMDSTGVVYAGGRFDQPVNFDIGGATVTLTPHDPPYGTAFLLKRDPTAGPAPFQALAPASIPTPQAAPFLTFMVPTSDQDLTSLATELLRTGRTRTRTASRV